ncbi:MAG: T9SS type A sorting domain-containing protein [Saprospiraceae bacterium]|nr:T9SS type A sorting domain-containing protein [Saprospiraceae bacterium]
MQFKISILILLPFAIYAQCPQTANLASNDKCIFATFAANTNPIPSTMTYLGSQYSLLANTSYTYFKQGATGNCSASSTPLVGSLMVGGSTCNYNNGILPIKEEKITISNVGRKIQINWEGIPSPTDHEISLERSVDRYEWESLMTYALQTEQKNQWTYVDEDVRTTIHYYRLKTTDIFGTATYSNIKIAHSKGKEGERFIYPNPGSGIFYFDSENIGDGKVEIYSALGSLVKTLNIQHNSVDLTDLPAGSYKIKIPGQEALVYHIIKE